MKYLTRDLKGNFGYIKAQTMFEIFKTIVLFAMALGIFFIGYFTLGTKKSLWSVIAVLALLPASKSLVGTIMLLRFKSISNELYSKIKDLSGNLPTLYEMIFTTTDKTYYSKVLVYAMGTICIFADTNTDSKALEKHINDVLKKGGHKDITVKVYTKESEFTDRLLSLREHFEGKENSNSNAVFNTLRAVAL